MLQVSQFREFGTNRVQMLLRNIAGLNAIASVAGRQRDQRSSLLDGEAKVPAVPNECQHFLDLCVVHTVATRTAHRWWDQANFFVVAESRHIEARALGQRADTQLPFRL